MEETFTTEAIVLNRKTFREGDLRVTLFCRNEGKINLIARGAKKISSKLAGQIEPLNYIKCLIIKGRKYDYLGSATTVNAFLSIKNNLEKVVWASRGISDFSRAVKGEEEGGAEDLFVLLHEYLDSQDLAKVDSEANYYVFLYKLLIDLGYKPELNKCVVCGSKVFNQDVKFSYIKSGLVCINCQEPEALQISKNVLDLLDFGKSGIANYEGIKDNLKFIEKYFKYIFN